MAHPKEEQLYIPSAGHRLAAVHHVASKKRVVICSHGYTGDKTEHFRLLVTLGRALAEKKYSVLRFDFMGSGDSTGDFSEMSPNTEIRDLHNVIRWAKRAGYEKIGLFGLSFGGAVTICTAQQSKPGLISCIVTWSAVPSFEWWRMNPVAVASEHKLAANPGKHFFIDRPKVDVPEAFCSLTLPKLQCQGTADLEGFRETFESYFPDALAPKKHLVIPDGDHTFSLDAHRRRARNATLKWFEKYLV